MNDVKVLYAFLFFISFQISAETNSEEPVVVTSSSTGSQIIEPGYSELSNYTKRKDLVTGIITLTPYHDDNVVLEWIIKTGSEFSSFTEASNYCSTLGDGWNRPLIRQIEIELKKDPSERDPAINEALDVLPSYGGLGTFPMTSVADAQFQYVKVIRREDPYTWVKFGTELNELDRYLCVRTVVSRPIGRDKE
jgi:hypothetical protein